MAGRYPAIRGFSLDGRIKCGHDKYAGKGGWFAVMSDFLKQHLIDPEICIRCYTCEEMCPVGAITHDDRNVVVEASKCNHCMSCIAPCPTGSIDNWRVVSSPYSIAEQLSWTELPAQGALTNGTSVADGETAIEALDDAIAALLAEAHKGAGGRAKAPASASKPAVNLYTLGSPFEATVQGNFRLTAETADSDVRHIILDLGSARFPILEGQSIGILAPGTDKDGKPHLPRLYSVSSPRDGERPNTNNLSLTVKREPDGVCSNYICDVKKGDKVRITGPFGATFLMPDDPQAKLIMVCTGTGSAPFRAFTMRRQRVMPNVNGSLVLFFGARTPDSLPYFGPLTKVPDAFLDKYFAFSRVAGRPKIYVQDRLREARSLIAPLLKEGSTYIYVCGLKKMESGVEDAFGDIAKAAGLRWESLRDAMRESGRYHVETY
jgi:benzoyl-CoA 2,3-dioxygenase component A